MFGIFVPNNFVWHRFVAQIQFCSASLRRTDTHQNVSVPRNQRGYARQSNAVQNPWLRSLELSQETCLRTDFEPKLLKPKLDFKKIELCDFAVDIQSPKIVPLFLWTQILGFGWETLEVQIVADMRHTSASCARTQNMVNQVKYRLLKETKIVQNKWFFNCSHHSATTVN